MLTEQNVILDSGKGETIEVVGAKLVFKATAEDTGGKFSIMEYTAPPEFHGPPAHKHMETTEIYFVLEGRIELQVGNDNTVAGPGAFVMVAPGTAHRFSNMSSTPARFLSILSPAGMEGYFRELPNVIAKHGYPPPAKIMRDVASRYDMKPA